MTRSTLLALLLACLSLVSKAKAETDVIAQPNAVGNSSIINQNMNINNGMTGKQQFNNLICSQIKLISITPFIQAMMLVILIQKMERIVLNQL